MISVDKITYVDDFMTCYTVGQFVMHGEKEIAYLLGRVNGSTVEEQFHIKTTQNNIDVVESMDFIYIPHTRKDEEIIVIVYSLDDVIKFHNAVEVIDSRDRVQKVLEERWRS